MSAESLLASHWATLLRSPHYDFSMKERRKLAEALSVQPDAVEVFTDVLLRLSDYNEGEPCWCPRDWWERRNDSGVHSKTCDQARSALSAFSSIAEGHLTTCDERGGKPLCDPKCPHYDGWMDRLEPPKKRAYYLSSVLRDVIYALRNQDDLTREDIAAAASRALETP